MNRLIIIPVFAYISIPYGFVWLVFGLACLLMVNFCVLLNTEFTWSRT